MKNQEKEIVLDTVKENILNNVKTSRRGIDGLSKSLTALQLLEEIRKTTAEGTKAISDTDNISYQKRNDMKKVWIGTLAPIITAFGLFFSLLSTALQNHENAKFQKDTQKDTQNYEQWKTLFDRLNGPGMATDPYIPILLQYFYKNDKYRENALATTTYYLSNVRNVVSFRNVINEYKKYVTAKNYKDLIALTSSMQGEFEKIDLKVKIDSNMLKTINPKNKPNQYAYLKIQKDTYLKLGNVVEENFHLASETLKDVVVRLIDSTNVDLSSVHFYDCQLDSIDFKNTVITNANFDNVSVKDADFRKVIVKGTDSFRYGLWDNTAWWQANWNKPWTDLKLLRYLVDKYPYNPNIPYYNKEPNDSVTFYSLKRQVESKNNRER